MATLIFTSGVFEGCIIDDKGQWKDELDCRSYFNSSIKLQRLFQKWLKKEKNMTSNDINLLHYTHINSLWKQWLDSWETEIWDSSDADYIYNRTEF